MEKWEEKETEASPRRGERRCEEGHEKSEEEKVCGWNFD